MEIVKYGYLSMHWFSPKLERQSGSYHCDSFVEYPQVDYVLIKIQNEIDLVRVSAVDAASFVYIPP